MVSANGRIDRTNFDDGTFRSQIAVQYRESAALGIRESIGWMTFSSWISQPSTFSASVFPVTVMQSPCNAPGFLKLVQNRAYTACQMHILDEVIRSWSQLGDMRNAVSDFVDPLQRVLEAGFWARANV